MNQYSGITPHPPDSASSVDDSQAQQPAAIKASIYFAGHVMVAFLHSIAIWTDQAGFVRGLRWRDLANVPTDLDHITPGMIAAIKTRYIDQAELDRQLKLPPTSWLAD